MPDNQPSFSDQQRGALSAFGLYEEQIEELEKWLPDAQLFLQKPPAVQDMREELVALRNALVDEHTALSRLLKPEIDNEARSETREWLLRTAAGKLGGRDEVYAFFERLKERLRNHERDIAIVEAATDELPEGQARSRISIAPVDAFDKALVRGLIRRAGLQITPDNERHYADTIPRTSHRESKYYQIMCICHQAMGRDTEPQKAVEDYISTRKNLIENGHDIVDESGYISLIVGINEDGCPLRTYLMEAENQNIAT